MTRSASTRSTTLMFGINQCPYDGSVFVKILGGPYSTQLEFVDVDSLLSSKNEALPPRKQGTSSIVQ